MRRWNFSLMILGHESTFSSLSLNRTSLETGNINDILQNPTVVCQIYDSRLMLEAPNLRLWNHPELTDTAEERGCSHSPGYHGNLPAPYSSIIVDRNLSDVEESRAFSHTTDQNSTSFA